MYKKILVPLDGSLLAADVLPHVQEIVCCTHAQVILLRVTPEPVYPHADAGVMEPRWTGVAPRTLNSANWNLMPNPVQRTEWIEHEVEVAQHYLDAVEAGLTKSGMWVETLVQPGAVAQTILAMADVERVDLITMSTHGWSGLDRFLLGSVANRVAHHAKVPVLLVRSEDHGEAQLFNPNISYKRILVPLDGSPLANEVLPQAEALAKCSNAEVLLLQVVSKPTEWPTAEEAFIFSGGLVRAGEFAHKQPELNDTLSARNAEHRRETAQVHLDSAATELRHAGLKVETLVQQGDPAETILEVAERCRADVIAMSTHGRSGLRRFLMGSVASRVLEYANMPLLLVRAQSKN
jgi:nucleotide-binding universal stress UspA family protein